MREWSHIFPRNTGLSLYIWIIFCVLPFYFIFRSNSLGEVVFGIIVTLLFFAVFWLTFNTRGPSIYIGISLEFLINIVMTILYGYVYFAIFIAFYIGSITSRAGFISMYVIHLVSTSGAILTGFFYNYQLFLGHLPFLIMTVLAVILIPLNKRNRLRQEALEDQLEDANQKISELAVVEERHRIARDLHDTLGQKLSMIGLKSELSARLIDRDPDQAKTELGDIQSASRQALNEVREMISDMKSVNLSDEINHASTLLRAADIEPDLNVDIDIKDLQILIESVLSMCLKEAVTNIGKHSRAGTCVIHFTETDKEVLLKVSDDGANQSKTLEYGNGLLGMRERLSFINGSINVFSSKEGFEINISVPKVLRQVEEV